MLLEFLLMALADALRARRWMLATAESCTGGLIAGACTEIVTYSNAAKSELLGVPASLIARHGAVSEPVARAMAAGALAHSHAQVSVAVTGIAGPGGGSPEKPVGTVWLGWQVKDAGFAQRCHFSGDRHAVRAATVTHALQGVLDRLRQEPSS